MLLHEGEIDLLPLNLVDIRTIREHFQEYCESNLTQTSALAEEIEVAEEKQNTRIEQKVIIEEETESDRMLFLEEIASATQTSPETIACAPLEEENNDEESIDRDFSGEFDDKTHYKLYKKSIFCITAQELKRIQRKLAKNPQPLTYYMDQLREKVMADRQDERPSKELRIVPHKTNHYANAQKLSLVKIGKKITQSNPFLRIKRNRRKSWKMVNT
jgi:hypothetical protein